MILIHKQSDLIIFIIITFRTALIVKSLILKLMFKFFKKIFFIIINFNSLTDKAMNKF